MTSDVAVRRAIASDLGRMAEIKVANWTDTYAQLLEPEVLARFLDVAEQRRHLAGDLRDPGTLLLVAARPHQGIIGFALTQVEREGEPWLESLHVIRSARGMGAGTALVRATAAELLARGHRSLRLGVVEGNEGASRFYERLGATRSGHEPADWAAGVWHEIFGWTDLETLTMPPG